MNQLLATIIGGAILSFALSAVAATPGFLPTQGVLRDNADEPIYEGLFSVEFSVYEAQDSNAPLWTELWPPADVSCVSNPEMCVQVNWGVFQVSLGTYEPLGPAVFASGAAWLGISVEGQPELPRVAMGTTPYAFIAASAQYAADAGLLMGQTAAAFEPAGTALDAVQQHATFQAHLDIDAHAALTGGPDSVADAYHTHGNIGGLAIPAMIDQLTGQIQSLENQVAQLEQTLEEATLGGLSCASGEVAKWSGTQWTCAQDEGGVVPTTAPGECDADSVGQIYFDTGTNDLRLCDGTTYRKVKLCSEVCPEPSAVACSLPINDDCGSPCETTGTGLNGAQCQPASVPCGTPVLDDCSNVCSQAGTALNSAQCDPATVACGGTVTDSCGNICAGNGIQCAGGNSCINNNCVPPNSCKAIRDAGNSTGNGIYTIDVDGTGPQGPIPVYCDMTTNGGGWTTVWGRADSPILLTGFGLAGFSAFTLDQDTMSIDSNIGCSGIAEGFQMQLQGAPSPSEMLWKNLVWTGTGPSNATTDFCTGIPSTVDGLWIRHSGVNTSFQFQNITVAFAFIPGDLVSATCGCAAGNPQRGFVSSGTMYVR